MPAEAFGEVQKTIHPPKWVANPLVIDDAFEDKARDLALPVEFSLENMNHFIDWQRNVPFQVIRGEGECAV